MMPAVRWLLLLLAIPAYEGLRYGAIRLLRRRWQRSIGEFLRRHQVELDHFRFIDRVWVRQALLQDPELDRLAAQRAGELHETVGEVRARIEEWLDEIVPFFNLFSYYKLGAAMARAAVRLAYEPVIDEGALRRARDAVPRGAVTVYVANHRSNADYVVLSVGALRHVALSYAVGEWARVWPLDTMFRSFGSYFVRRGEKDWLYHRVLARYLQLVASRGLTTAFFPEGGLSRDGALREPKIGLLDYLVGILRDEPARAIVFIPVGLNFDQVFEDRNLTREAAATPPPSVADKARSFLRILLRAPRMLAAVLVRGRRGLHLKAGYAAIGFGAPLALTTLLPDAARVAALPDAERRPAIAKVADALMAEVAKVVPATPVPLVAAALEGGARTVPELRVAVRELLARLRAEGRPIAHGRAFRALDAAALPDEAPVDDAKDELDRAIVDADEAESAVHLALRLLARRRIVTVADSRVEVHEPTLIRYYAASLEPPHRFAVRA